MAPKSFNYLQACIVLYRLNQIRLLAYLFGDCPVLQVDVPHAADAAEDPRAETRRDGEVEIACN